MKQPKQGERLTLTNTGKSVLLFPMNNAASPQDMLSMADKLEETARVLRQSATLLQQLAGIAPQTSAGRRQGVVRPMVINQTPTVTQAVTYVLSQANGPVHISDIYARIRSLGADVKDQSILSSMLSKDYRTNFIPVPGKRGFWTLVLRSDNSAPQQS